MILKKVDITFEIGDKADKLAIFSPKIYIGKNKPDKIAKTLITKFKIFVQYLHFLTIHRKHLQMW